MNIMVKDQVGKILRSGWYGIYKIGHLRKYLDQKMSEKLVHAFITSHLDYCNGLLAGLPDTEISRLQRLQNASARVVTRAKRIEHISPVLCDLHWLPVHLRVNFKILLTMYKCSIGQAPIYLRELITPYAPTRSLRSASLNLVVQPKVNSKSYGAQFFSCWTHSMECSPKLDKNFTIR